MQANINSPNVELHEMTESVKPRRRYQSPRRAAQAEQTRRDIVTAAGLLFRERGYGVPLADIASEAGVVVETVYRIFGNKAALFRAAVEGLLAGGVGRAEIPVEERPAIRAIRDEPDPRKQVAGYAATQPGIHRRAGPLLGALRDARGSDPELGRLWDEMEAWRLDGQGRFVRMLASREVLRPGLTVDVGIDITWTLCSLAVYDLLALDRGWGDERYETWLTDALIRELLAPGAPAG
jgi:TetR/AcrR family transcriptional regulator, regulator of autoinduction and epiphytic fitness